MVAFSLLVGVGSAIPVAAAANVPTSDGALHFQPPLNNGPAGDPAQADSTLFDSVVVEYCKITTAGCTPVGEANSVTPGVDLLLLLGGVYTTAFSGTAHGVNSGDRLRITVRVAGLSLGSTQLTANVLALLPSSTQFNPLVPLNVQFRIDRNPVIRTRYLHDHGRTATEVAGVLKNEFGLDDATAAAVLYNDVRVGDVTAAVAPAVSAAATPGRTPYGVQDLVDAVGAPSTYGDNATRTAQVVVGKFPNQDIVNALVASPNQHVDSTQLLGAMRDGLGVTDPQQQLKLFEDICVPGVSCPSGPSGPPCIPNVTCPPPTLVCSAIGAIMGAGDQAAQDFRSAQLYPDPIAGAKFLSTPATAPSPGCGFDLNTTARLLELVYFSGAGSGADQAKNVASTLKSGFVPGGLTPDNVVAALAKAPIQRQGSETLSCVASVGAITGAGLPLLDPGGGQNGVLNALGNNQSLLDNWQQTGAGNGLDTLGACLAKAGIRIPFPLLKVHVQYTEAGVPATSAVTGRAFVVGRTGWLPQLGGQQPSLDAVRGVPALKALPVPNLSGPLRDLTMLPSVALTGGCLWYSANAGDACSTAVGAGWPIPGFDTGKVYPPADCPARGETCGAVVFATAGGGSPGVGEYTMVVPALPGFLNFEASTLVNPDLAGCVPFPPTVPAIQAGALAASAGIWKRAPNGSADYLATGGYQIVLDGKNEVHQSIKISEDTESHCGRITSADPHLTANVDVTFLKSVTDVPGALGQTTVAVPAPAQGQDATGAAQDFSIVGAGGTGIGAISDLSGITGAGNLFSALAEAGVPVSNANALATLMRTGFMP